MKEKDVIEKICVLPEGNFTEIQSAFNYGLAFLKGLNVTTNNDKIVLKVPEHSASSNNDQTLTRVARAAMEKRSSDIDNYFKAQKRLGFRPIIFKCKPLSDIFSGSVRNAAEAGISVDRNTGYPLIPASSVKGVLRLAYMINYARQKFITELDSEDLQAIDAVFGSQNPSRPCSGKIVIFDAYVKELYKSPFKDVYITPHHQKYHAGERFPNETEEPIPIEMTCIDSTSILYGWYFPFLISETASDEEIENIKKAFNTACCELGFGARTSLGFGRFNIESTEEYNDEKVIESNESSTTATATNNGISVAERHECLIEGKFKVDKTKDGFIWLVREDANFVEQNPDKKDKIKCKLKDNGEEIHIPDELKRKSIVIAKLRLDTGNHDNGENPTYIIEKYNKPE